MIVNIFVAAVIIGIIAWRVTTLASSSPKDETLIRQRYQRQGWRVLEVKPVGADLIVYGLKREPIRKYEVVVEDGEARREFRQIGVQAVLFGQPRLWRYDDSGIRKPIF